MSTPTLVILVISVMFIAVIVAGLISEHRRNKR